MIRPLTDERLEYLDEACCVLEDEPPLTKIMKHNRKALEEADSRRNAFYLSMPST